MTVLWFIVWLIANNVGGHERLLFDPVNAGPRRWFSPSDWTWAPRTPG